MRPAQRRPVRRSAGWRNLNTLRDLVDEIVSLFPAQARVGDGLAKDAAIDRLVAVLKVRLDHKALDQLGDGLVAAAAVEHLLANAVLLQRALARVVVVAVDDRRRVGVAGMLGIALGQALQVLVVVIGVGTTVETDVATHDGVCEWIAVAFNLPVAEDKALMCLGGVDGVEHDGGGTGGGVLHAHRHRNAARYQAMLLVFDRAGAYGDVAQQVDEVLVVGRVEHLVGGKETGLLDDAQVHMANGLNAFEQVIGRLGVGVVQQALVAGALGARLVGVDARNDDELVLDLFGDLGQPVHVLKHRILAVGRARADDEYLARVLAGKDFGDLGVKCLLFGGKLGGKRHFLADLHGDRQPAFEIHGHAGPPQSNRSKHELSNARHYPLSHTKVQARPTKKGTDDTRTCLPREWIISRFRPMFAPKVGDYPLSSSKRPKILARDLPKRDRFILAGFIWANAKTTTKGTGTFVVVCSWRSSGETK